MDILFNIGVVVLIALFFWIGLKIIRGYLDMRNALEEIDSEKPEKKNKP